MDTIAVSRLSRIGTLLLAFLSKNVVMSVTYGVYGLLIPLLERAFQGSLSSLTIGISLVSLMLGLSAPLVGFLLDRWSLAGTLTVGCILAAAGLFGAASAESIFAFNCYFGVLLGLGTAFAGANTAAKLAASAYPKAAGKAMGFAMLPVSSIAAPLLLGFYLESVGWRETLRGGAYCLLGIALVAPFIVMKSVSSQSEASKEGRAITRPRWFNRSFLPLAIVASCCMPMGIIVLTFIVPISQAHGASPSLSALFLAITGGGAVAGAYLLPWLADHIPPKRVIGLLGALYLVGWSCIILVPGIGHYWLTSAVLGMAAGASNPSISVYIAKVVGAERLGALLGRLSVIVLPVNVTAAPLVGWSYDLAGNYKVALLGAVLVSIFAITLSRQLGRETMG